jgi:hypothetical protein
VPSATTLQSPPDLDHSLVLPDSKFAENSVAAMASGLSSAREAATSSVAALPVPASRQKRRRFWVEMGSELPCRREFVDRKAHS